MYLCDKQKCTGCGLCKEVCHKQAIGFEYDRLGFRYPIIEQEKCIGCGMCSKKCPELNPVDNKDGNDCYLAWAKDDSIHYESASGGVSYLLAKHYIEHGGFSVGCIWDEEFNAILKVIDNLEDLRKTVGSKYVQSYLSEETWNEVKNRLKAGQKGVFLGLPCQVAAMKAYTNDNDNLILCEILCHGACSPLLHQKHIAYLREHRKHRLKKITDIRFRGGRYDFFYTLWKDGHIKYLDGAQSDTYFHSFSRHILYRESCYTCSYARGERIADITIGDFWGIDPSFLKDKHRLNGFNLVIVHSKNGDALLSSIKDKLELYKRSFDEAIIGNEANFLERSEHVPDRAKILDRIAEVGLEIAINEDPLYQENKKKTRKIVLINKILSKLPEWAIRYIKLLMKITKAL